MLCQTSAQILLSLVVLTKIANLKTEAHIADVGSLVVVTKRTRVQ